MALFKYWTRTAVGVPFGSTASTFVVDIGEVRALRNHDDSVIRTIFYPTLTALVGSPTSPVPSERWWQELKPQFSANFDPSGTGYSAFPFSSDPLIISSAQLQPTINVTTVAGTGYSVRWDGPKEGIQSFGQRKGTSPTALPGVHLNMFIRDPERAIVGSLFSGVTWEIYVTCLVLWGSRTAT